MKLDIRQKVKLSFQILNRNIFDVTNELCSTDFSKTRVYQLTQLSPTYNSVPQIKTKLITKFITLGVMKHVINMGPMGGIKTSFEIEVKGDAKSRKKTVRGIPPYRSGTWLLELDDVSYCRIL